MIAMVEHYTVTLTDQFGMVSYVKAREEVADFVKGINWDVVRMMSVEPLEPLAEWEKELLNAAHEEEAVLRIVEDEWRIIEDLPTKYFEINKKGDIRHKLTKRVRPLTIDPDYLRPCVELRINGQPYYLRGPELAKKMWSEDG